MSDILEILTNSLQNLSIDNSLTDSSVTNTSSNTINIDNNQSNNIMAENFKSEYLKCIPQFDGNPNDLNQFLSVCDSLIINFYDRVNPNNFHNVYLLQSIISKLVGSARTVVNIQNVDTWDQLKSVLRRNFADQRDETCLNRDLVVMRQMPNEKAQNFYDRILNILNLLCSYVEIHENIQASRDLKKKLYNDLALKTFLCGLKEPLGTTIRCMRPENLAVALQFVTEEENTHYFQNSTNKNQFKPNNSTNRSFQQNVPNRNFNNPQYASQNRNFFSNQNFNRNNNQFPTGPIQFKQNVPNQNVSSNARTFRNTSVENVFKPNPNRTFPKPTPMSSSTRYTGRINNNYNNNNQSFNNPNISNHFAQPNHSNYRPQQNYIAEELYNTEIENTNTNFCEESEINERTYEENLGTIENFHITSDPMPEL